MATTDERDDDRDRNIYALTYKRKVLFTKSFDISIGALPRWKPKIFIDVDLDAATESTT